MAHGATCAMLPLAQVVCAILVHTRGFGDRDSVKIMKGHGEQPFNVLQRGVTSCGRSQRHGGAGRFLHTGYSLFASEPPCPSAKNRTTHHPESPRS